MGSPATLCAGCMVHQGFYRNFVALRGLQAGLLTLVTETSVSGAEGGCGSGETCVGTQKKITSSGMSMGAPLAILATIFLKSNGFKVLGTMTLGMPRVGNKAIADEVFKSCEAGISGIGAVGFAYGRDPVPHVPPRFLGYRSTQMKLFNFVYTPEGVVMYSKMYSNCGTRYCNTNTAEGDKEFAMSTYSYDFNDHMLTFDISSTIDCGFDRAESFILNSVALELFFM